MGNELTNLEINFAQQLFKAQFTSINGLESTLHQQLQKMPVPCQRILYEIEFRFCFVKSVNIG